MNWDTLKNGLGRFEELLGQFEDYLGQFEEEIGQFEEMRAGRRKCLIRGVKSSMLGHGPDEAARAYRHAVERSCTQFAGDDLDGKAVGGRGFCQTQHE